jgi:hypothetical protein
MLSFSRCHVNFENLPDRRTDAQSTTKYDPMLNGENKPEALNAKLENVSTQNQCTGRTSDTL